jgi:hypothetical protein
VESVHSSGRVSSASGRRHQRVDANAGQLPSISSHC